MTDLGTPIYDKAAWDNGFAPMPDATKPCPRCTAVGAPGLLCDPCAGEIATALRDPDDELTAVYYPAHSPALDQYRADVRLGGLS